MQQTTGMKRFALNHLVGTALALGILVSSLTAAATLSLTGDLPDIGSGGSARVVDSGATTSVAAAAATRRQLSMERNDYDEWRRSQAQWGVDSSVATRAQATDAERRQLKMERDEFDEWRRSFALPIGDAQLLPAGEGGER